MYQLRSLKIVNIISFKEQTFKFRNGKAVLIVGQNLDDSSQNGNGSGKSSLIESIALAFTGSSIRDVKTRELIHAGEDTGEVTLTLYNEAKKQEFIIYRKIYSSQSKSSEYKAWINGKEQSNRYSDLNMFNAFVWDTVGISKEDFFSFFLITKENYNPFLLVGDTKKKEIINRFSGADKVDLVFPEIQGDSEDLSKELAGIEKELTQNQTRQAVLAEQLIEEETNTSEEKHQEAIQAKETEIQAFEKDILLTKQVVADCRNEIKAKQNEVIDFDAQKLDKLLSFQDAVKVAEAEVKEFDASMPEILVPFHEAVELAELEVEAFEFSKNYDDELLVIASKRERLHLQIANKKKEILTVKNQFAGEIEAIAKEEDGLYEELATAGKELKELEQFESDVNKQLQDSIECPNCHHHFSLRDESFNYEEAKKKIPEVQESISEYKELMAALREQINTGIQEKHQAVNVKIEKAGDEIREEIAKLNDQAVELGNQELALKREQQVELQAKQVLVDLITGAKRSLQRKKQELDHSRQQLVNKVDTAKMELRRAEEAGSFTKAQLESEVKRAELNLKRYQDELAGLEQQLQLKTEQLIKLREQEIDRTKIQDLEMKIVALVAQEENIKIRMEEKRKEKEDIDRWEIHFKNFKSHLANKSIKNIQDYTNLFLNNMGSNLAINIDGYKTLANKKIKEQITTSVLRDGFDSGSYGKFSGGERGRIDICNIIGMQELISVNAGHGKGLDMLLADEILESVDTNGMECIINSLQSLGKTIMLVSQNEINTLADYTLTIQKKNKVSTILN